MLASQNMLLHNHTVTACCVHAVSCWFSQLCKLIPCHDCAERWGGASRQPVQNVSAAGEGKPNFSLWQQKYNPLLIVTILGHTVPEAPAATSP